MPATRVPGAVAVLFTVCPVVLPVVRDQIVQSLAVPSTDVVASDSNVIARATNPLVAVRTVVKPMTNAVATVANAVGSIPVVVASLPGSATPVRDVITTVQDVLTSVAAAGVPLAQLPSDLASLLGFPGMAPGGIGGSLYRADLSAAVDAPVLSTRVAQWPQNLLISDSSGVSTSGNVAGHPTVGSVATTGFSQELSVAPVAPDGAAPTGAPSFLEYTVNAVLLPASLMVLAALALPGIAGLLIIAAAGMLVGYRQAKAASTLRAVGIAHFARLGPLGVVHSGSLVALRPRASKSGPSTASTGGKSSRAGRLTTQHRHIQPQIGLEASIAVTISSVETTACTKPPLCQKCAKTS
jgi:hypothetical protein